jgi:RNA polymerase sigma-70 factor (ECF subfamily)
MPRDEAEVCRHLAPRVLAYGRRHLRNEHAAADLVQDTLVVVVGALRARRVSDGPDLLRFTLATCRNLASDRRRTARRRDEILAAAPAPPPAELAANRLDHDRLLRCLEALPERDRSVLVMTFYDERPAEEIASALVTSAGNVRVLRHRALLALRTCVDGPERAS